MKETNQAPPWLRYTEDLEDAREDWEPMEPGVVPPGAPPGLGFCLGAHAYVGILVMLVLDYDSIVSQCDRAKMQ